MFLKVIYLKSHVSLSETYFSHFFETHILDLAWRKATYYPEKKK